VVYTPGQQTTLPTDRTTATTPEDHLDDHLTLHGAVNDLTALRFIAGHAVPSGWWGGNLFSWGASAAAPVSGTVSFAPLTVHVRQSFQALGFQLAVLQVGGAVTCSLGLYAETNGYLVLSSTALLASGSVNLTSAGGAAGKRSIPLGPRTLDPGIYWAAFQYNASTAPTTIPTMQMIGNNGYQLPHPDSFGIGQTARGYRVSGVTALPVAGQSFAISGSTDVPVMELRAA